MKIWNWILGAFLRLIFLVALCIVFVFAGKLMHGATNVPWFSWMLFALAVTAIELLIEGWLKKLIRPSRSDS